MVLGLLTQAGAFAASKVLSVAPLAKVGGAASGGVLAGLSSLGKVMASKMAITSSMSTLGPLKSSVLLLTPAGNLIVAVVGGVVVIQAAPAVLGAIGFTKAGIAASSIAAKMMSVTAIANGGGVPAGSMVAFLQSAGAKGLALSAKAILGSAGALVSAIIV